MGTKLVEVDAFDADIISPNPGEGVRASGPSGTRYIEIGLDPDGGIVYTAIAANVRVRQLGGLNQTLLVTVSGNDITVQLGTDAGGAVTSTANAVVIAFNAVGAAVALATVSVTGTGAGLAGISENFMKISGDPFGSVRPPFQSLTDRTAYLRNSLILGTRTVKKLHADGAGGNTSAAADSEIWANNALQTGLAAGQGPRLEPARLIWRHTANGTNDANPSMGTALKNELRALSIPKSFGTVVTDGAGGFSSIDGMSFSVTIFSGKILITMATAMDNTSYTINATLDGSTTAKPTVYTQTVNTSQFFIVGQDNLIDVNPATTSKRYHFTVFGRQTTT